MSSTDDGMPSEIAAIRRKLEEFLNVGDAEELHLVTGNVDSRDKQSVLVQDYPGGRETVATHFRCTLPPDAHSGTLEAEFVREFPTLPRVEGIAVSPTKAAPTTSPTRTRACIRGLHDG